MTKDSIIPKPAKGLYATRLVDLTFVIMGLGAAILLGLGNLPSQFPVADPEQVALAGPILLSSVILTGIATCLFHRIDRRGWDDYMGQVMSQSALIGMVTLILAGALSEFVALKWLGGSTQLPMIVGMIPMAALAWAMGYFFLRWRGTGQ